VYIGKVKKEKEERHTLKKRRSPLLIGEKRKID